jgi:hypothetical protein
MAPTITALILDPDNPTRNGVRDINADQLPAIIGGYLEAVYGHRGLDGALCEHPRVTFFCDEEGKLRGRTPNQFATTLWWHYNPAARADGDVLCGTVVVVGGVDRHGESQSMPSDIANNYLHLLLNGTDDARRRR